MSISVQLRLIIFSFTAGIITGILFDIYRLIRGVTVLNKIVVFIEDILFWTFAAIAVFAFLLYTNYAYTDAYVYLWIALGIYIYFKILSRTFFNVEKNIFKLFGRLIRIIVNFVLYPVQFIIYRSKMKKNRNYKK
jgi:spore cortex biosynthesis protein YabQ